MILHFYSTVTNGNIVEGCLKPEHYTQNPQYLYKDNFLSEFRSSLEKAKARANLGIGDSLTLEWGNIQGEIINQTDIAGYIDNLLAFIDERYPDIKNVRDAAKACLNYLSEYSIDAEAIDELQNATLFLFGVKNYNQVKDQLLTSGLIHEILQLLSTIHQSLADVTSAVEISDKEDNALTKLEQGEDHTAGLYVKDVSLQVTKNTADITLNTLNLDVLLTQVNEIDENYVKKSDLGNTEDYDFVTNTLLSELLGLYVKSDDNNFVTDTELLSELQGYVKSGEGGSLGEITVNSISASGEAIEIKSPVVYTTDDYSDSRRFVDNIEQLHELTRSKIKPGMDVIVVSTSTLYILLPSAQDLDPDTKLTSEYWKMSDSLRIIILESIKEYLDKLNAGEIQEDIYYYIKEPELDYTSIKRPDRSDFESDEDYNSALTAYLDAQYMLYNTYVTGAWAKELEDKLGYKANITYVDSLIRTIDSYKEDVLELLNFFNGEEGSESLGSLSNIINSINIIYTNEDGNESGLLIDKTSNLLEKIEEIYKSGETPSGLLVEAKNDIATIKENLYGTEETNPIFVTWEDLGSESSDLGEGTSLFVKTSDYNATRESDANKFSTKELVLSDVEGEHSLSGDKDNVKYNLNSLAFSSELLKNNVKYYDRYSEYKSDLEQNSGNLDKEFAIILSYDRTLNQEDGVIGEPVKSPDESESEFTERWEDWARNTLLTYYDFKQELNRVTQDFNSKINLIRFESNRDIQSLTDKLTNVTSALQDLFAQLQTYHSDLTLTLTEE